MERRGALAVEVGPAGAEGEHVTVVAREQSADGRPEGVELLWERLDEADL
jgi:hypothetical protein